MSHPTHLPGGAPRPHVALGVSPVTRAPEMLPAAPEPSHRLAAPGHTRIREFLDAPKASRHLADPRPSVK